MTLNTELLSNTHQDKTLQFLFHMLPGGMISLLRAAGCLNSLDHMFRKILNNNLFLSQIILLAPTLVEIVFQIMDFYYF